MDSVVHEIIDESLNLIVERHTDRIAIDTAVHDVMTILSDAIRDTRLNTLFRLKWFFEDNSFSKTNPNGIYRYKKLLGF